MGGEESGEEVVVFEVFFVKNRFSDRAEPYRL